MTVSSLDQLIRRLPPGRARARYERLIGSLGEVITVNLTCFEQPLWLVPDAKAASILRSRGVPRWRIWTLHEVREFIGAFGTVVTTLAEAAHLLEGPEAGNGHLLRR